MNSRIVKAATCMGCGCVCDDIELHINDNRISESRNACELGRSWFNRTLDPILPSALIDGKPATLNDAIHAAASILDKADLPLIYGLGNSACEAQREAVYLTEQVGGVIDSHASIEHGPTEIALQMNGKIAGTLGEIKNRADVLVFWGCNPAETHPRHFERYSMTRGKFTPNGRGDRTAYLVDVRETPTAELMDHFIPIKPGMDFEALTALRAIVKGQPVDEASIVRTGIPMEKLRELAQRMMRARYGVLFFGAGLSATRGKHINAMAAFGLVTALNDHTRFIAMPLRIQGNVVGADMVIRWNTAYPFGVSLNRGYPRSNPGEFTTVDLLVRNEVDAALILGADPHATMPHDATERLGKIPTIVLDPRITSLSRSARVHITTAASGISAGGTAYRMDKIPLPVGAPIESPFPSDQSVLRRIREALSS